MALSVDQKEKIKNLLRKKIENKLKKYGRETSAMPFLARLIQDNEKIASYSFIHSLATTLGISIYEEVSVIICEPSSKEVFRNYGVGGVISKPQKAVINKIVTQLRNKERTAKPNIDIFEKSKTKLLEWVARKRKVIKVYLVLPYNPYHPEPYTRFTEVGMMDHPNDFLVGNEYWDFI